MQQTLDMKFQAKSSIWSHHCGIVSLNSSIILSASLITIDQRLIACTVSHVDQVFEPFTIVTIYAPASVQPRREFYFHIMKLPMFSRIQLKSHDDIQVDVQSSDAQLSHRLLITGDFNYSPSIYCRDTNSNIQSPFHDAQQKWHNFLLANFNEVSHPSLENPLPTFRRGTTLSTIDYLFSSLSLTSCVQKSKIEFINSSWTDHALLSVHFQFGSGLHGKGLWRANPYFATNPHFVSTLYQSLDWFCSSRLSKPFESEDKSSLYPVEAPQLLWDAVKIEVKRVARSFGRKQASWRELHISRLQAKRERILNSQFPTTTLHTKLTKTEQLIGNLQTDIAKNQILKAHKHWRENGETSAGYLKRSIATRSSQRYISSLQHPKNGRLCTSPGDLQDAAREFYQTLYQSDPINESSISTLLDTIPENTIIHSNISYSLLTPFTIDDLIEGSTRSPRKSSPGMDGLPYEIISLLFNHPGISKLAIEVYNDALLKGIFPPSWLSTSTTLLPKKGDLTSLKNWRPISLINTDAKIFTRLLNHRLMSVFSSHISPNQMGFMPQRFIGENGRLLQLIMTSATIQKSNAIGLLLNQEKAYDRIHPGYLTRVLCRFGVPLQLVDTIIRLFFSTKISININGFLTEPFIAQRGLRQGDPLSPLLFNIAFDPFLRLISNDPTFHGFSFTNTSEDLSDVASTGDDSSADLSDYDTPPPPVKILAYADDVLVLVNSPSDFTRLQWAVDIYTSASNALLNYNKTQAFSLSGQSHSTWQEFLSTHNILSWHDSRSTEPLTYLGYPVYSSISHRNHFVDQLINKITLSCQNHSQRNLSIRGRVTVLNCLVFSKLWHVLRIVPLTQTQISKIQGIGGRFLNSNSFPRISFSTLSLPRSKGGLGALDPAVQNQALQWRWLNPMLLSTAKIPNYSSLFPRSLFPSVTYGQYLLQVTSPPYRSHPRISGSMALLFDVFRSHHFSSSSLHCFSSLFSALDSLVCRSFDGVSVSPATVLNLPLSCLIYTTTTPVIHPPLIPFRPPLPQVCKGKAFRHMVGSNIMIRESSTNCLRFRSFTTIEIQQFSRTSKQIINLLASNNIQLRQIASFHLTNTTNNHDLIDFTPIFLSIFNVESASLIHRRLFSTSPKIFKQLKLTKQHSSPIHRNAALEPTLSHNNFSNFISPAKWSAFWRLPIPLQSRTIWFKIIHRSIPHASLLHRLLPQKFTSALCPLCLAESDSTTHFFYTCHKIQPIWIQISTLFIEQNWQHAIHFFLSDISSAVSHLSTFPLRDPSILLAPSLSTHQIVACVLQAIWSSRWQFIFHDIPFHHGTVSIQVQKYIEQLAAEIDIHDDAL